MAYTLRNVSRDAHKPRETKMLNGETNKGIGSVKKMVRESARLKAVAEGLKQTKSGEFVEETEAA